MSWIDVGSLDDIPLRGARVVKTKAGCIALFRTDEAEVFATSSRCAHKGGPLAEGIVHDRKVTCPLHSWVYSLDTGEVLGTDEGRIDTYPVQIKDGRILLEAAAIAERSAA